MNLWKVLGLAGVAGVAAAGVIIAQEQRQRAQLSPEEIRARLHERLEQAPSAPVQDALPDAPVSSWKHPRWLPRRPHTTPRWIADRSGGTSVSRPTDPPSASAT